ncbi:hypothetical protein V2J09_008233 [Rumex salicifolius]
MICGGKSLVSCPPAFSNDAKKLLVCTGNTVSIFSTSTGMLIAELVGHNALVTSVTVVPSASKVFCFCWTSSLDGTIRYWDFSVPELVKTIDIQLPIFSMVIPSLIGKQDANDRKDDDVIAYVSLQDLTGTGSKKSKPSTGLIRKCSLKNKSALSPAAILAETAGPAFLTASPSGQFFGIQNKRTTHLWMVPDKDYSHTIPKRMKLHHTKIFSALAFHPTERIVAAGDVTGRILIWRGFGAKKFSANGFIDEALKDEDDRSGVRGNDDAESCSTWHWHSDEVKVLSFSSDGAYLYSGGHDGVLVLWQIDTRKQKFLPRIGSPLLYFVDSPDPLLSAISCADNRVLLLKMPSLEILKSISGIKLPCSYLDSCNESSKGFAFDQVAGLLCLPTENYCIQFYSLLDNHEIAEVQVCERNHQPGDDITIMVTSVTISPDGSVMCTAETRLPEDGLGGLISLKFWACESQKKDFKLSTIVYEPHRDADISAIAFHPASHMVASASHGGDFKVWVHNHTNHGKDQALEKTGWTCHSVGSYKKKPMTAAAFSADGSVLAVSAETVITLWDAERNYLVAVLSDSSAPIRSLSFVGNSEYLLSASQGSVPHLSVWSLPNLSLVWSYKFQVQAVACLENTATFAVLALFPSLSTQLNSHGSAACPRDGIILIFNAGHPDPVASWSVRKANGGGLVFLQSNKLSSEAFASSGEKPAVLLAYVNSDHEYVVFDPYSKDSTGLNSIRQNGSAEEDAEQFGYTALYGELPKFEPKVNSDNPSIIPSERPWETMFTGPSYSLPPLTKLCSEFLESLLEKRVSVAE